MRIKLLVEYDGTDYAGWQRQNDVPTVQQCIEDALGDLLGTPTVVHGAGRTDAGVHAMAMPCHFDAQTRIPADRIAYALNFVLPKDIRIKESCQVADTFHARFDAKAKWYRYTIYNHRHASALNRRTTCHVPYPLDLRRMSDALHPLLGKHDFGAFAASGSKVENTVREIYVAELHQLGDCIVLDVIGSGFLYNMVRIIAGTLMDIGRGKCEVNALEQMIRTGSRLQGGITAPPQGLMMMRVFYQSAPTYQQYLLLRGRQDGFSPA